MDTLTRFLRKTSISDGCWMWTGNTTKGYPNSILSEGRKMRVTHWALLHYRGIEVPEGMETDHLCHTAAVKAGECDGGVDCSHRRCVNPEHLEVVSRHENTNRRVRQFACRRGHPRTEENVYVNPQGKVICRVCRDASWRAWRAKHSS